LKTTVLEIYAMLVCLLTVICFTVALGIGLYDVFQMTFPDIAYAKSVDLEIEKFKAMRSLVQVMIILFVDAAVFIPHWIIGKRARKARSYSN
jgi:cbb3-type cytochrome oxidase subunit 1